MHQPPGNIDLLLRTREWEAKEITLCYERPLRYVSRYEDTARILMGFSGPVYCWSSSAAHIWGPHIIESFSAILDLKRVMQEYSRSKGD